MQKTLCMLLIDACVAICVAALFIALPAWLVASATVISSLAHVVNRLMKLDC